MLHPIRTVILAIEVLFLIISQAFIFGSGCSIEIKLPLAVVGLPHRNFTRNFMIGKTLKFHCVTSPVQITYVLAGAPKVICQSDNTWSSKIPKCKATFCSPSPPIVPNAQLLTIINPGNNNRIGAVIQYRCIKGYSSPPENLRKVCQKDGYWQGSVSCKRTTCIAPVMQNGFVSYTSLVSGGIATYVCDSGYTLTGPSVRTCGLNGLWSGNETRCSKLCRKPPNPLNGYFIPGGQDIFKPGAMMTLKCIDRYAVRGSKTRMCQENGEWTGIPSKCVINSCGSPGSFFHGRMVQDKPGYIIGTTVTFECFTGYKLLGPTRRQCRDKGVWSERKNPICVRVHCSEPGHITHGYHKPDLNHYPYNGKKVVYGCYSHYFIWPSESRVLECKAYNFTPYWSTSPPACITLAQFSANCKRSKRYFSIKNGQPDCIEKPTIPTSSNSGGNSRHSMDTLTIVTASAGSTLGVLVIILSIMVFVRRFHRNRRFRHHAIRSRFYSDDDHVTLIACPRGFHFALPSYDEAMSQVQRDPPPFESVVQVNSTTVINNNSNITPSGADPSTNDGTVLEVSVNQQVNIVSNPLTENQQQNEPDSNTISNPGENSNRNSIASQDSLVISEVASSHDGIALSLSEDEQSVNEAQPLIGSN